MRCPQSRRTRCRSLGVRPTAFIAHPPDLQFWPSMDVDFANACPLVRPALPRIRFMFVGSRLCSTLPSDSPSRFCPCASLVLHLHQVAQGTSTPKLSDMSDTQAGLRPPPSAADGLDRVCHPTFVCHQAFDRKERLKSPQMSCQLFSLRHLCAGPDNHPQHFEGSKVEALFRDAPPIRFAPPRLRPVHRDARRVASPSDTSFPRPHLRTLGRFASEVTVKMPSQRLEIAEHEIGRAHV